MNQDHAHLIAVKARRKANDPRPELLSLSVAGKKVNFEKVLKIGAHGRGAGGDCGWNASEEVIIFNILSMPSRPDMVQLKRRVGELLCRGSRVRLH